MASSVCGWKTASTSPRAVPNSSLSRVRQLKSRLVESFRKRRQLPRWLYLQFRHWKKIHGASKENTMPNTHHMLWFKQQFRQKIEPAIAGTPFTVDFLTALACQETGEVWPILRKKDLSLDRILELCVGDTKDA